jgi:UDP-N-acetylmuramoylalanine--D-glutamate ligase
MPHAYVIGLGKSGIAAARLLNCQGWNVTVSDRGWSEALQHLERELATEGITVQLSDSLVPDPRTMQQIVVSPGVPWDLPALMQARAMGIETIGETELAWRSLQPLPWVGITGTNGKTTTTALIAAIFQAAGLNAPACGNIGYAVCELALAVETYPQNHSTSPDSRKPDSKLQNPNSPDWIIAELSSYQIEASSSIAPEIGVWTTFTPDHLSRHYTLENYYHIKAKLLNQSQQQVINGDDPYLRQTAVNQWPDAYWTSVVGKAHLPNGRGAYIEDGWVVFESDRIVPVSALRMVGSHNQQNLLIAVLTARLAKIAPDAIVQAIETFPGVPHRLEHICTWNGIDLINDSKATNYDAAQVGLSAVASPAILIAGGEAKAGEDTAWIETIQRKAAAVLLIGNAAPAFAQRFEAMNYTSYEIVETLERAVSRAAELGTQLDARVILLSPACASFDQYPNFEQRGEHFRQLCQELLT